MAKEVAKQETAGLPAGMSPEDVAKYAGMGSQGMQKEDYAVPFLLILQKNTPECDEDRDVFIDGAKPGMFFNRSTGKMYPKGSGPVLIPVAYERKFVEWVPLDDGGGFVDSYPVGDPIVETAVRGEKGILRLPNGNDLVETAYNYCMEREPSNPLLMPIVVSMKSTGLKKSRRWNSQLSQTFIPGTTQQAPRWLYPWQFGTVVETKDSNSWHNFDITRLGTDTITAEEFQQCAGFYDQWAQGEVKLAEDQGSEETPF